MSDKEKDTKGTNTRVILRNKVRLFFLPLATLSKPNKNKKKKKNMVRLDSEVLNKTTLTALDLSSNLLEVCQKFFLLFWRAVFFVVFFPSLFFSCLALTDDRFTGTAERDGEVHSNEYTEGVREQIGHTSRLVGFMQLPDVTRHREERVHSSPRRHLLCQEPARARCELEPYHRSPTAAVSAHGSPEPRSERQQARRTSRVTLLSPWVPRTSRRVEQ